MKRNLINTVVAAICISCMATATALPSKDGYSLVCEDNFEGDSLNRRFWNVEVNGSGCGNNELQYYIDSPENVGVSNGNLVLTAVRRPYKERNFTSGRINTLGKVGFTYGIIEASIRLPETSDGLWPAFWMMGDDIRQNGWPKCGETDILEMGHADGIKAGSQDRLFNGALHWGESPRDHRQLVGPRTNGYSLQDGKYHTYTVVWTPERISMFVDDDTVPYLDADISGQNEKNAYFHKANFLLFNLAIGGNFPGIHDAEGVTALGKEGKASMEVDYVRVYQKDKNLSLNTLKSKK